MHEDFRSRKGDQIKETCWRESLLWVPVVPRRHVVVAFRLETRHDCLAGHLFRFNIFSSPNCVLCWRDTVIDASHLKECPEVFGHLYDKYWQTREKLQDLRTA
ncbi:hypothetical protein CEXT_112111 [Caerostris extrusa]|uniref:Uncharacterized protein n=1 Tax=Caerostris extrusa TaxID=172846 RepID=A0AAV4M6A0_CAEEX|nr:hypothetical protein CEXT_112111 [Caerostris extrusa]